jgi:long-subunit acyl-CoA synthetase (AMP-forming)
MNDSLVLRALAQHAEQRASHLAIETLDGSLDYATLQGAVDALAEQLKHHDCQHIALLMDNSPAVVIADLAVLAAQRLCVPVPLFFSPAQMQHLLCNAGIDTIVTDMPEAMLALLGTQLIAHEALTVAGKQLSLLRLQHSTVVIPQGCHKITYTSGSTGEPKGVCLSQQSMEQVAQSLCQASQASADERHLSMLPFATLLENIGGVYTVLLSGATLIMPPLAACGLRGSSALDVGQFVRVLCESKASSCILIPQMLQALIAAIQQGMPTPQHLRYIAVGGAPVAPALLQQAASLKLPVYEGYGLSEASSVVTVNRPDANRPGSVGQVLPHVQLHINEAGDIALTGSVFLGYLGDTAVADTMLETGDVGYLDEDGYLYLVGRKKHIFITAFGRNVSPEWVERELLLELPIAQACVFGEARPFNTAIIVARDNASDEAVQEAINRANDRLPDYAQVHRWIRAAEPFTIANQQWTGTGRPRRQHIQQHYQSLLDEQWNKGR